MCDIKICDAILYEMTGKMRGQYNFCIKGKIILRHDFKEMLKTIWAIKSLRPPSLNLIRSTTVEGDTKQKIKKKKGINR